MATRLPAAHHVLAQLIEHGTPSIDVLARYLNATPTEVVGWSARREALPLSTQDQIIRVALAFVPSLIRPVRRRSSASEVQWV